MITIMSHDFRHYLSELRCVSCKFSHGNLIFEQGDPVNSLYRVETGTVHLLRRQENGAEFILQRAGAGTILAEASLTTPNYHCAAVAVTDVVMSAIPRQQVLKLVANNADVAVALVMHLGREVRHARLRAEIGLLRKVSDKLDAWLAWNGGALPKKGGWQSLAQELGVSPEALYRELANRPQNQK